MAEVIFGVVLSGVVLLLVGHSFIDTIFKRQEEIINRMTTKGDL